VRDRARRENLRDALLSPFAVSGLPVRVTTFAQQDASAGKVRLLVAAQIGTAYALPRLDTAAVAAGEN